MATIPRPGPQSSGSAASPAGVAHWRCGERARERRRPQRHEVDDRDVELAELIQAFAIMARTTATIRGISRY